ncbi:MAG: preprotein translocase subunit SecA [Candidatus Paceibacteria bacterium]|jgi:preprotein translocase subunit SecA
MSFLNKLFSDENTKSLKKYDDLVQKTNDFEPIISKLSDEELRAKTDEFKAKINDGNDILPEAFAVVRETSKRLLEERHYDVQLIGGAIISDGNISEMRTGEGKTLVATLPVYLHALYGKGIHVVTVNDYLSRRDAVWMGQIYSFLGLTVGIITQEGSFMYDPNHSDLDEERDEEGSYKVVNEFLRPITRREAYQADITYGTNSEFGFDYLRDNIELESKNLRQRGHHFAVVDEIDSVLIDEARTPLIISAPAKESEDFYKVFAQIATNLNKEEDFEVDEKLKAISLTDSGIEKAEKVLGIDNMYTEKGVKFVHHLETAVRAKALFNLDKEYVVKGNEVIIVDEFTGRLQPGRRWSEGLHQAIEAKENVPIQRESRTYASITYQNYFKMYEKLSGMTGTAKTSAEEFRKVYGLDTIVVPTNKEIKRDDKNDLIYQTTGGKLQAISSKVKEVNATGQPVLIGTVSIEDNEALSNYLKKEGVEHTMLNAKNHEREGEIIAQAGKKGSVTIATNMAGRGVDIKLGGVPFDKEKAEEIKNLGGLFVLGTERHEARRIDNQLRGRSGRQGDPGLTQFFVSLEDSLMRVFASDMIKNMMGRFNIPENQPIENKIISKSLESAQTKIEGFHFDSRKHILEFDNVLNTQRESVYKRRKNVLVGNDEDVLNTLGEIVGDDDMTKKTLEDKKNLLGDEYIKSIRRLILQTIDVFWVEHLEAMSHARNSVGLRAYGQREPLIEYKKEGKILFDQMKEAINHQIVSTIPNIGAGSFEKEEERLKQSVKEIQKAGGKSDSKSSGDGKGVRKDKFGRNDLVTITKGGEEKEMKYKKAEPMLEDGWVLK